MVSILGPKSQQNGAAPNTGPSPENGISDSSMPSAVQATTLKEQGAAPSDLLAFDLGGTIKKQAEKRAGKEIKEGVEGLFKGNKRENSPDLGPTTSLGLTSDDLGKLLTECDNRIQAMKKSGKDTTAVEDAFIELDELKKGDRHGLLKPDKEARLVGLVSELRTATPEIEAKDPLLSKENQARILESAREQINRQTESGRLSSEDALELRKPLRELEGKFELKDGAPKKQLSPADELRLLQIGIEAQSGTRVSSSSSELPTG